MNGFGMKDDIDSAYQMMCESQVEYNVKDNPRYNTGGSSERSEETLTPEVEQQLIELGFGEDAFEECETFGDAYMIMQYGWYHMADVNDEGYVDALQKASAILGYSEGQWDRDYAEHQRKLENDEY